MIVKNRKGVAARQAASVLSWSCAPDIRRRWGAGGCLFIGDFFINRRVGKFARSENLCVLCASAVKTKNTVLVTRHEFAHVGFHFGHFAFDVSHGLLESKEVFKRGVDCLRFLSAWVFVEKVCWLDLEYLSDGEEVVDRYGDFAAFEFAVIPGAHAEFFSHVFLAEACKGSLLANAFTNDFVHDSKWFYSSEVL